MRSFIFRVNALMAKILNLLQKAHDFHYTRPKSTLTKNP